MKIKYTALYALVDEKNGSIEFLTTPTYYTSRLIANPVVTVEDGVLSITGSEILSSRAQFKYRVFENVYIPRTDVESEYNITDSDCIDVYLNCVDWIRRKKTSIIKPGRYITYKKQREYSFMVNPFKLSNVHLATKE